MRNIFGPEAEAVEADIFTIWQIAKSRPSTKSCVGGRPPLRLQRAVPYAFRVERIVRLSSHCVEPQDGAVATEQALLPAKTLRPPAMLRVGLPTTKYFVVAPE